MGVRVKHDFIKEGQVVSTRIGAESWRGSPNLVIMLLKSISGLKTSLTAWGSGLGNGVSTLAPFTSQAFNVTVSKGLQRRAELLVTIFIAALLSLIDKFDGRPEIFIGPLRVFFQTREAL